MRGHPLIKNEEMKHRNLTKAGTRGLKQFSLNLFKLTYILSL
jgi:hypothetical protein